MRLSSDLPKDQPNQGTPEISVDLKTKKIFGTFEAVDLDQYFDPQDSKNKPGLTAQNLKSITDLYTKAHPGTKLALSFPSNDESAVFSPKHIHKNRKHPDLITGGGLAIPYQQLREENDLGLWVCTIPATFRREAKGNIKLEQALIEHYITGLYFQAGQGNGVSVPIRKITGNNGSESPKHSDGSQKFTHPSREKTPNILLGNDQEYAWGANIDPYFCKNHGAFLEAELNKLNQLMYDLNNAPTAEDQNKIIQSLKANNPHFYSAFVEGYQNPLQEWYGSHSDKKVIENYKKLHSEPEQLPKKPKTDKTISESTHNIPKPNTDPEKEIDQKTKINILLQMTSELTEEERQSYFKNLSEEYQEIALKKRVREFYDESFTKTQAYQKASEAASIWEEDKSKRMQYPYMSNYTIKDLVFKDDKFVSVRKIDFRANQGKEDRHITPVAWISKAFKKALVPGMSYEEAKTAILSLIEPLIDLPNTSDASQYIFDFYKKPGSVTNTSDFEKLLKFAIYFYNQKSIPLAMSDDYIKIDREPHTCRLVPFTQFTGSAQIHSAEGSLVTAYTNLIDAYNALAIVQFYSEKGYGHIVKDLLTGSKAINDYIDENEIEARDYVAEVLKKLKFTKSKDKEDTPEKKAFDIAALSIIEKNQQLNDMQLEHIAYSLYGSIDYMPIDKAYKRATHEDGKKKGENKVQRLNQDKHRHENESVEQLYKLAAAHLQVFFTNYPFLEERYKDEIIKKFIRYMVHGVKLNDFTNMGVDNKNPIYLTPGFDTQYTKVNNLEAAMTKYITDKLYSKHFANENWDLIILKDIKELDITRVKTNTVLLIDDGKNQIVHFIKNGTLMLGDDKNPLKFEVLLPHDLKLDKDSIQAQIFNQVLSGPFVSLYEDHQNTQSSKLIEDISNLLAQTLCEIYDNKLFNEATDSKEMSSFAKLDHFQLAILMSLDMDESKINDLFSYLDAIKVGDSEPGVDRMKLRTLNDRVREISRDITVNHLRYEEVRDFLNQENYLKTHLQQFDVNSLKDIKRNLKNIYDQIQITIIKDKYPDKSSKEYMELVEEYLSDNELVEEIEDEEPLKPQPKAPENISEAKDDPSYELQAEDIFAVGTELFKNNDNVLFLTPLPKINAKNPAFVHQIIEDPNVIAALTTNKHVLLTINKDNNHWVSAMLTMQGKSLVISYKDSLGNPMPAEFSQFFQNLLKDKIGAENVIVKNYQGHEQREVPLGLNNYYVNCGIFALKNLQIFSSLTNEEIMSEQQHKFFTPGESGEGDEKTNYANTMKQAYVDAANLYDQYFINFDAEIKIANQKAKECILSLYELIPQENKEGVNGVVSEYEILRAFLHELFDVNVSIEVRHLYSDINSTAVYMKGDISKLKEILLIAGKTDLLEFDKCLIFKPEEIQEFLTTAYQVILNSREILNEHNENERLENDEINDKKHSSEQDLKKSENKPEELAKHTLKSNSAVEIEIEEPKKNVSTGNEITTKKRKLDEDVSQKSKMEVELSQNNGSTISIDKPESDIHSVNKQSEFKKQKLVEEVVAPKNNISSETEKNIKKRKPDEDELQKSKMDIEVPLSDGLSISQDKLESGTNSVNKTSEFKKQKLIENVSTTSNADKPIQNAKNDVNHDKLLRDLNRIEAMIRDLEKSPLSLPEQEQILSSCKTARDRIKQELVSGIVKTIAQHYSPSSNNTVSQPQSEENTNIASSTRTNQM